MVRLSFHLADRTTPCFLNALLSLADTQWEEHLGPDFVIVRIENGAFAGLECVNPAINRVAVVTDGMTERVALVRQLATEEEIAEAVRIVGGCQRMGAWHALDAAGGIVHDAAAAAGSACAALAEAFAHHDRPRADVVDLEGLLADGIRIHALRIEARRTVQRLLDAIDGYEDAHAAADGTQYQQPLSYIEGDDHVRH